MPGSVIDEGAAAGGDEAGVRTDSEGMTKVASKKKKKLRSKKRQNRSKTAIWW